MELAGRTVVITALIVLASSACASGDDPETENASTTVASADSPRAQSDTGPATGTAAVPTPDQATDGISVMTGVYTKDQAARGAQVYAVSCGQCHTMGQHSGTRFAAAWDNRKLYDLYYIVRTTMPVDEPGGLSDQEYLDVVAYMLQLNGIPAGKVALDSDPATLKGLRIEVRPSTGP